MGRMSNEVQLERILPYIFSLIREQYFLYILSTSVKALSYLFSIRRQSV